jgi:hypothetical protein
MSAAKGACMQHASRALLAAVLVTLQSSNACVRVRVLEVAEEQCRNRSM